MPLPRLVGNVLCRGLARAWGEYHPGRGPENSGLLRLADLDQTEEGPAGDGASAQSLLQLFLDEWSASLHVDYSRGCCNAKEFLPWPTRSLIA